MSDAAGQVHGVVLQGTGGVWRVLLADGNVVGASMRGRLKQDMSGALKLTVGDDVLLERDTVDSAWVISSILPRRSQLARRSPGAGMGERVIVANVDQVVVVFAAANPEPHPRMIDRFLVIAEANSLRATIVINKVDLVSGEAARERFELYSAIGYDVHYTSAKRGDGLDDLHMALKDRVSALSGPSGVGKSSLLNAMYPGFNLRVGEISASVNKGRHTTVGATILALPDSGFVVDTPGLREIGMWGLSPGDLDVCFPEIAARRDDCRFKDCAHIAEPQCAVRDALHLGRISVQRYDSYVKLRGELEELIDD